MNLTFAQRRRRDLIVAFCLAGIAALVPLFVKDVYVQNIMVLTLMYAALSQSWNILSGYCGQISLGHALYFGVGAYTTALLFTKFGVLPWFGISTCCMSGNCRTACSSALNDDSPQQCDKDVCRPTEDPK